MKTSKKYCRFCGAALLAAIIITAETLSALCHECGHVTEPHVPERSFVHEYMNNPIVTVSGISDTAFTSVSS